MCTACLSRRRFLTGAAVLSTTALAGCDGPPDLVSDAEVERMGLESWARITAEQQPSRNRDYVAALNEVSSRLLAAAPNADPSAWEFRVFASPEANAFALPGGKIGVYEGMFEVTQNLDQLAAIVGHEIGHIDAEHGQERLSAQVAKQYSVRILAWLLQAGEVENAQDIAAALGLGIEFGLLLPYSREHELEADRLGLILMNAAGFDPREAVPLWQRMEARSASRPPEFLATHPAPRSRIEAIEAMLPELT